jgi:hypothetical protein
MVSSESVGIPADDLVILRVRGIAVLPGAVPVSLAGDLLHHVRVH